MKRLICALLCIVLLACVFAGCNKKPPQQQNQNTVGTTTSTVTDNLTTPTFLASDSASPSFSTTTLPPETPTPTPTATPVPTPTPTIRPAQKDSIVPSALLTTGYTAPLDPASVNFPKNYNMPYYIEVDIRNQCVNIFIKDETTGKYDILLNRFVCSGGTSTQPTKTGNFFIKSDAEQKQATGQNVKYTRYYFKKYESYAYYVTRYSNEYMFHSFTFSVNSTGQIVPKKGSYYNMGNTGSAGCLRLLMNHAKWIYENIDAGTYVVVNNKRPLDSKLRSTLKKYVPLLGYDMVPSWNGDRNNITGLPQSDFVHTPDVITTHGPIVAPSPTQAPTVTPTISPVVTPTPTQAPTPTPTETPILTPTPTPTQEPVITPTPMEEPVVTSTPEQTGENE